MKVSLQWLKCWVDTGWDADKTAEQLTMAGLEVDGMIPAAGEFNDVIVAEVTATSPHPDADKLTLCQVNTGDEEVHIVCGAHNVRAGLKVALAKVGAKLPNGLKIKPAKLRGQPSHGMLCSAVELGMAEQSDGIMELETDASVGQNIRDFLKLDDTILDIDLTPNRSDCFSVRGVAREVAALARVPVTALAEKQISSVSSLKRDIHLNAGNACPRFCGLIIDKLNPEAITPLWMQERLRRCGLRTIHPIVDITNYVMMELGQPMHAYDNEKLQGSMQVRFAKEGESLTLLDDKVITMSKDALVIADDNQALSLAGVMGGMSTAVTPLTTSIFLEVAFFNPKYISGVARGYGLCTDSSQRFERGVDPGLQQTAMAYACDLIQQICGGEVGIPVVAENLADTPDLPKISFRPEKVAQLTGVILSDETIKDMLVALGMEVDSTQSIWIVVPPSCRFDIQLDVDLVEEVVRLNGYQHIEGDRMKGDVQQGHIDSIEQLSQNLTSGLVSRGYHETITYSFVDPEVQSAFYPDAQTMNLLNPLSTEMSQMRLGLWPGLVASMLHNLHRQHSSMHLFESGVVFGFEKGQLVERPMMAGLALGQQGIWRWNEENSRVDFYDVKGDLMNLLSQLGLHDVQFDATTHPALHPGQSATLSYLGNIIGLMGQLHPSIAAALDINQPVFLFELSLSSIKKIPVVTRYHSFSKYPLIRRDLALLVDEGILFDQIKVLVEKAVGRSLLKGIDLFDIYQGDSIPEGKKSLAISISMQASDRTLTDDEINNKISAILKILNHELSIELREK